jgi:hypothetical protein
VYATAAKTPLIFRQIVGRFVRTLPGRTAEPSWLYLPADPVLRDHAESVEKELRHALRRDDGLGSDGLEEFDRPDRTETEPGEGLMFEPLSADVAPQMTLFGPPAPASMRPVASPAAVAPVEAVAAEREPAAMPAFERRALLRSRRHELVSEITRRDRCSHREVNAWLNRRIGIARVDEATLAQLERSVQLLLDNLSSGKRVRM